MDKTKRIAQKLVQHKGSMPLASMDMTMEMCDKIEEVAKAIQNIPKVEIPEPKDFPEFPQFPEIPAFPNQIAITLPEGMTLKGEKGDKGDKGEQGIPGKNGTDGIDGLDGVNGKDGIDGKDGSPDTGDQIIQKINSLDEKAEKIDAMHIKNLPKAINQTIIEGAHGGAYETPIKTSAGVPLSKDAQGAWVLPATGSTSPLTTKGDIYTYSTTNDRLPVGTNGQVLSADSTQATGLKWTAAPSGNLVVGTTAITGGSTGTVLTDSSGTLQELAYSISSTGLTLVERDTNANIFVNNYFGTTASTVSAGGTTTLTVASARNQNLTGSSNQTFQLPDATTLTTSSIFLFNNNSSGSLIITNNGGSTLYTVPAGGYVQALTTDVSTANGVWDFHAQPPLTVTWSSGASGLIFNTALTTTPQILSGASSSTSPSFIPQRGASTTGFGGDGTSLYATIAGAAKYTFGASTFTLADALDLAVGTSTGTKIGTSTSQKLAFYNSTPIVQPTGDVVTALQNLGLVASATIASATNINTATESTDTTCFPVFVTASGTQTLPAKTNTTLTYNSNTNDLGVTKINGLTMTASTGTFTLTNAKTLSVTNTLTLSGTDSTTMTFPTTSASIARTDAAQTFTGIQTFAQILTTPATITVTSNAGTVTRSNRINNFTNSSAATMTITMSTTSAVDGDMVMVVILDASAVAQTITWVNTENSTVTVPTTSNGSTTLPLTVGFKWNSATSKWRCIAKA